MKGNGTAPAGSMRQSMPITAAFVDALRDAFGRAEVDGWIAHGIRHGGFWARENGHEIGRRLAEDA